MLLSTILTASKPTPADDPAADLFSHTSKTPRLIHAKDAFIMRLCDVAALCVADNFVEVHVHMRRMTARSCLPDH